MNDADIIIHRALLYPLAALGRELDQCSPELRRLLRLALAGVNGGTHAVDPRDKAMAAQRLNEAVTTRTREAKARIRQCRAARAAASTATP